MNSLQVDPYALLHTTEFSGLARLGWERLRKSRHGDLPGWLDHIDRLPVGNFNCDLNRDAPVLGAPVEEPGMLEKQLLKLQPWRKGPLQLGGISIDTEWRSDLKWRRIAPHLELGGCSVLDIGCGNGYFGFRMLGAGAKLVVGIDPTLIFVMQWLAMQKMCPGLKNFVLPLGIDDLPANTKKFDRVFSMGVLYHRRQPVEHLEQLKSLTRPGGQIVLETLVLKGEGEKILDPQGRYCRMRNVHAIPTLGSLLRWLEQAGLPDAVTLDVSATTTQEQRSTRWMTFESLQQCLDRENPFFTVEGHPAPVRAALLIKTCP